MQWGGSIVMGKKTCWAVIIITIAVNVVMLQWTVEAFLGREHEDVLIYSGIAIVMAFIAFITYKQWKKIEYSSSK
ncbi:hypothetical protein SAMN05421736_10589 [Evansella caseinilytica]|uniref:Uncharacterized protein n=1 Tax=Evansella caseinilytica TaxID=1503961 RepID=A0A1H3PKT1_9BACI|nr:hypothetical protein SAMN05421736_10589 [Evansella caseinilytica]